MDLTKRTLDIIDLLEENVVKVKKLDDGKNKKKTVVIEKAVDVLEKSRNMLETIYLKVSDDKELNNVLDYVEKRSNELVNKVIEECDMPKEEVKKEVKKEKLPTGNETVTSVKKETANPLKEWLMEDKE